MTLRMDYRSAIWAIIHCILRPKISEILLKRYAYAAALPYNFTRTKAKHACRVYESA